MALVLLVVLVAVAFAMSEDSEPFVLLKPGQSAALLCDDGQTPDVVFLRAGGIRATCPANVERVK